MRSSVAAGVGHMVWRLRVPSATVAIAAGYRRSWIYVSDWFICGAVTRTPLMITSLAFRRKNILCRLFSKRVCVTFRTCVLVFSRRMASASMHGHIYFLTIFFEYICLGGCGPLF